MKEAKFKVGDKCKVIKNLLANECVGDIVTITKVSKLYGRYYYKIQHKDKIEGIASEGCLDLVK